LANLETGREKKSVELVRGHFRGKAFSQEIGIKVDVTPARIIEQAYFALHLAKKNGTLVSDPVFTGVFSAGRPSHSIPGWIDGDYFDTANFPDDSSISLNMHGFDLQLFKMLGDLVPQGGSLMVSYSLFSKESRIHRDTRQGLDRGYPPAVTPLGFLLFIAGCGMGFKDWYFAEGGREGPEKLQGYKPLNSQIAKEKAEQMLQELRVFLGRTQNEDNVASECKSRADQVMRELQKSLT
jgi:hypothetical protein